MWQSNLSCVYFVAARNFPAMRFGGRILYSKTASEVDKRAMQLLKVLDTKRDESGRAIVGFDIEWRPSFRKGTFVILLSYLGLFLICLIATFVFFDCIS